MQTQVRLIKNELSGLFSLQKLLASDEAVIQPRHCFYSNIYVRVRISVHNSVSSFSVLSLPHHPPCSISPIVPGLRGVGGHSKRLLTQFKVSFIEQKSS